MDDLGEMGELAAALAAAQGELTPAPRDAMNPHFGSKFASLASVVKTAAPILSKHGFAIVQCPGFDENGEDTLTTVLMHSSGELISSTMHLHSTADTPQALGSALTYARRYAYSAMIGVVAEEDDDDGNEGSSGEPRYERPRSGQQHRDTSSPGQATDNMTGLLRKLVGEIYEARHGQTLLEENKGAYLGELLETEPVKITGIGFKECSDLITKVMAIKKGGAG